MGFVQGLGDVEGFLGAEAELLRAQFLQGAEVEGQGRGFTHALSGYLYNPGSGRIADGRCSLPGQGLIEAAALIVAGVFGGAPLRGEAGAGAVELDIDGPERHRHEVGDAAVAVNHQAQGRGLYPAHGEYALVAGLTSEQGEEPAHVHPDQPVGPRAAQGRMVKAEGLAAGLERGQCLANRGVIQCRQPQPANRPAIAAVLHQLPGNHLALAVGIGGDDQLPGFTEQTLDRLELAGSLGLDQHLPLARDDRQIRQGPALVAGVVAVGRGRFEQVADAPGDSDVGAYPAAVTAAVGAEDLGNILGLGGFFAEKQAHAGEVSFCGWGRA
ncbi:hypothetical protein D3C77_391700 [compost metagenome]